MVVRLVMVMLNTLAPIHVGLCEPVATRSAPNRQRAWLPDVHKLLDARPEARAEIPLCRPMSSQDLVAKSATLQI